MAHRFVAKSACAALAFSAILVAAAPAAAATQATSAERLPAEQRYAGIHYTTEGVTPEEAKTFKRSMHAYPLAIELVEKQKKAKDDLYSADATVRIADHAGKQIFDVKAGGPFMLVHLDPGPTTSPRR